MSCLFNETPSFFNAKFNLKLLCKVASWCSHWVRANKADPQNLGRPQAPAHRLSHKAPQRGRPPRAVLREEATSRSAAGREAGTWHLDDLHPVQQGRRDSGRGVGGRDEENLGKVEGHVEIMVGEVMVLFRI